MRWWSAVKCGWLVLVALALAFGCGRSSDSVLAPAGVIVISLDTLRADHLGAYGYARETSPRLDRLGGDGIVFERAIAQASSTTPSHRSLFQGRIPSRTRVDGAMLAEHLRARGFRTAAFTGGGYMSQRFGFAKGFEVFEDDVMLADSLAKAIDWLGEHAGQRLFLFLHTYDIHLPYDPPSPYDELFGSGAGSRVDGRMTRVLLRQARGKDQEVTATGVVRRELSAEDRQRIVDLYDGGVRYVDDRMGELFDALRSLGIWDSLVIVVLSDHGEEFWDHGSVIHSHTLYQELVHVPLILRLPGARMAGRRVASTVPLTAVAPTILDLLGLPPSPAFDDASLLPLLAPDGESHRNAVSQQADMSALVRFPWKLIRTRGGERVELYHLEDDPTEQKDLARVRPDVVDEMQSLLSQAVGGATEAPVNPQTGLDEETRARLEQLGYLE